MGREFNRAIKREKQWWMQTQKKYTDEEDDQEVGQRHKEALREITTK